MIQLKGICPIIATPFTKTGEVDFDSLQNEIKFMADVGCTGATLFGIAGEYYKLSESEQIQMVKVVVDSCQKFGINSIISVTTHATELAVHWARRLQEMGADSLMLLPPFFMHPGASAINYHMKQVCNAVSIPVVLQYAPEQTGVSLDPSILASIGKECTTDVYYKIECKPAGAYTTNILQQIGNAPRVFIGNAGYQFIELFDRGAIGVMPGCSMSDLYIDIYNAYISGDREKAMHLHGSVLLPMLNHIRQNAEQIIAYEKTILFKRGIIATDYCRKPTFAKDNVFDSLFEEFYERTKPYLTAGSPTL